MALTGHLVEVHVALPCEHPESMHSVRMTDPNQNTLFSGALERGICTKARLVAATLLA